MNDFTVWAANGEHEMPAERARELAWVATGGQTGIVGPASLRVTATATPSNQVRVRPGSFAIQATPGDGVAYASAPRQTYTATTYETNNVSIRSTGSSGGRVDVVGVVINDPQFEGTTESVNWGEHRFFEFYVFENAGSRTQPHSFTELGRPFLPLARVDIPSSTATITSSMITDIRHLAWKQEDTQTVLLQNPTGDLMESGYWYAGHPIEGPVVPQWATHVKVMGEVTSKYLIGGSIRGRQRLSFWSGDQTQSTSQLPFFFQDPSVRMSIPIAGRIRIRPGSQGQPVQMRLWTIIDEGDGTLRTRPDESWMRLQLVFETAPTDEYDLTVPDDL